MTQEERIKELERFVDYLKNGISQTSYRDKGLFRGWEEIKVTLGETYQKYLKKKKV